MPTTVRMVVTRERLVYAGRTLEPGEEFDAEEQHVEMLTLIDKARVKEADLTYGTRAMESRRQRRTRQ